jgi:hypothetical protein
MAVAEQEHTASSNQDLARKTALAAAAAAATGAATYAVKRALSHESDDADGDESTERTTSGKSRSSSKSNSPSLLASAAAGGWDAARDALVPIAEDAADAAGTYLAKHGPDFVTETIVPRFIEAFEKARG